jgi:hypothetical protein
MKNKRTISFLVCALLVFGICTPLVSADTAQELEEALISEEMAIAMELEAKAKAEKEAYNTYPEEEVYTIGAEENAFESEEFVADNGSESEDVETGAVTSFNTQDMLAWGENISWKFEDGYLGVEGMDAELLASILAPYAIDAKTPRAKGSVTKTDLYEMGLSGGAASAQKRERIAKALSLPPHMSANALLEAINLLYTKEEFLSACKECEIDIEAL